MGVADWTSSDAADLYQIDRWSEGYFAIHDDGRVHAQPSGPDGPSADLFGLMQRLRRRGVAAPVLMRFDDIVNHRVGRIQEAFANAIQDCGYRSSYRLAYPIKVNQQSHVVETVRHAGGATPLALEVGSKPELLAGIAIHDLPDAPLICNGYKDSEYIELVMLAAKLGRRPILVIEQPDEIGLVLKLHEQLGVELELGVRMKPSSKGAGRWGESGGDRSKFGLNATEIIRVIQQLEQANKLDWLKLLHFHVGSQITSIGAVTKVVREAARIYTEVSKLCPSLAMLNCGGGLGVDYDGSRTDFESSMNYTISEYALELITGVQERCDAEGVEHPAILTESGRATVAHHSVLIVEATDVHRAIGATPDLNVQPDDSPLAIRAIELILDLTIESCRPTLHETLVLRDDLLAQFLAGDLSLQQRGRGELILRHLIARLIKTAGDLKRPLEELSVFDEEMVDTYFCNFSIFQSIPDAWAIGQLFPIMPIQRLDEQPRHRAVIADLTCDSDGKMNRFISSREPEPSLPLHSLNPDEPYYLGIFLVGAYQEILGDLHNLFGDTNAAHVSISADGATRVRSLVRGDTMRQALEYVEFSPAKLIESLHEACETALENGSLSDADARVIERRYLEALDSYTYLVKEDDDVPALARGTRRFD
jgi:arginine decarboxylase